MQKGRGASPELIVALDVPSVSEALSLRDELRGVVDYFKVGSELYTAAGPEAVFRLVREGARVFLDLKFHDIPNTVQRAVRVACRQGVSLLDIHASGGEAMMKAAVQAARLDLDHPRPLVFAVTVLTSLSDEDLDALGLPGPAEDLVLRWARVAHRAGVDGVVCSPREVETIRKAGVDRLQTLVPGVRPAWARATQDQKRVATPFEVARLGATYVVVGRAITSQRSPKSAALRVREELLDGGRAAAR